MPQVINKAINPKDEENSFALEIMPCRSGRIRRVQKAASSTSIGGSANPATGTVSVPIGSTASERHIRYHEAMHAEHTPKSSPPRDMLDQALEDARLHRYKSTAATSSCTQARRDELAVALRELRGMRNMAKFCPLCAAQSLATMRARAILESSTTVKDSHARLLADVTSKLGPNANRDMGRALAVLAVSDGDTTAESWAKARAYVGQYFTRDFDSDTQPQPKPKPKSSGKSVKTGQDEEESESDTDTNDTDDTAESGDDDTSDTDTDGGESEDTDATADSGETNEGEDEDSVPEEPIAPIAPIEPGRVPREPKTHPDEYTADLTPKCDIEQFKRLSERIPLKLYIRRLDMGINRVKIDLGRRELLPVMAGSRINPAKLAAAVTTPGVRTFRRKVNQGGAGTILIDASGSTHIPEQTLIDFCSGAPALTLAFYNAPHDHAMEGNIYIYAANGYRAALNTLHSLRDLPGYGYGNVIDYHAMAWLIKQPGPHYLVTDCEWTGRWEAAAENLFKKLRDSKQLELVPNLSAMTYVLNARKHHSPKSTSVLMREYFRKECPWLESEDQ